MSLYVEMTAVYDHTVYAYDVPWMLYMITFLQMFSEKLKIVGSAVSRSR